MSVTDARRTAGLLLLLLPLAACPDALPDDAAIAAIVDRLPSVSDADVARIQRQYAGQPPESAPGIDRLPEPVPRQATDLGAIAEGYRQLAPGIAEAQGLLSSGALLAFVSFTMPEASLTRLLAQAERSGARVLLRGLLHGSLRETVTRVQALTAGRRIAVQIDPQAFKRFQVEKVPTYVLLRDGAHATPCATSSCVTAQDFVAVSGDVTLDYALEQVVRLAPDFAALAAPYRSRLGRR